jgi:hypothetical protein
LSLCKERRMRRYPFWKEDEKISLTLNHNDHGELTKQGISEEFFWEIQFEWGRCVPFVDRAPMKLIHQYFCGCLFKIWFYFHGFYFPSPSWCSVHYKLWQVQ